MTHATAKILVVSVLMFAGCSRSPEGQQNTLTEEEKADGWLLLFDGRSPEGWRGFNEKGLPDGWVVDNGTLKSLGKGGDIGGDIVYAGAEFDNFELLLEWKLSPGGNSGIFYHVHEDPKYQAAYENAPEYQLIDDIGFPQKLERWQTTAADYAMYDPDTAKNLRPIGEWNTTRIVFRPDLVEYWLNGGLTVSFVPWSDDWNARKSAGKWKCVTAN